MHDVLFSSFFNDFSDDQMIPFFHTPGYSDYIFCVCLKFTYLTNVSRINWLCGRNMSASSESERVRELSAMIEMIVSRLPPERKVTAAVLKQLLTSRYGDKFSSSFLDEKTAFIELEIKKFSSAKRSQATKTESSDDEEDDDEEDSDEDEDEEDEEEEGEEEEDEEEEDEEDDEEDSDSVSGFDEEDEEHEEGAKSRKRPREEDDVPAEAGALAAVCNGMANCIRKVGYRIRPRRDGEEVAAYVTYLKEEFEKRGMNPAEYDKAAISKYKCRREVELLQRDGASLQLDRTQRAGRGFASVPLPNSTPTPPICKTSKFLDDE